MLEERFYSLGRYLKKTFGERVNRATVHLGGSPGDVFSGSNGYSICAGGTISAPVDESEMPPLKEQLQLAKEKVRQRFKTGKFVIYISSDPSRAIPLTKLSEAFEEVMRDTDVLGININLRPKDLTGEMIQLLNHTNDYIYMWVELGIHTIHNDTLRRIGMDHTHEQVRNLIDKLLGTRLRIAPHVVLGLPGETPEMMRLTMEEISQMNIQGISIHPLTILKDTPLEDLHQREEIRLLERDEYVNLVCDFIEIIPEGVVLHKIVGEAAKEKLIAPDWAVEKRDTIGMISAEMEKRGSTQGCKPIVPESIFTINVDE